jgi:predicted amino acid racemase
MHYPRLEIDLEKIKSNTEIMVKACKERGISVAGVTKVSVVILILQGPSLTLG